jgi:hypothetical protein
LNKKHSQVRGWRRRKLIQFARICRVEAVMSVTSRRFCYPTGRGGVPALAFLCETARFGSIDVNRITVKLNWAEAMPTMQVKTPDPGQQTQVVHRVFRLH